MQLTDDGANPAALENMRYPKADVSKTKQTVFAVTNSVNSHVEYVYCVKDRHGRPVKACNPHPPLTMFLENSE